MRLWHLEVTLEDMPHALQSTQTRQQSKPEGVYSGSSKGHVYTPADQAMAFSVTSRELQSLAL